MHHNDSRSRTGEPLPRPCPDCGATPHVARPDPRRHAPLFHHADTCPISLDEDRTTAADAAWLAARAPGAVRVRRLSRAELCAYEQVGRPIPSRLRKAVRVHVTEIGPGRLLRRVEYGGVTRGMVVVESRSAAQR